MFQDHITYGCWPCSHFFHILLTFLSLDAFVKGSPQPLITWFVNGMEILPSPKYQMEYEKTKAVLAIHETNAKDSGEYTCMAENDLGMQTSSFYMHVPGKLYFFMG